jgi:hypothetical protein
MRAMTKPMPAISKPQVAGIGDTVMDLRKTASLPNVAGKADIFGRTRDTGRVMVRFVGLEKVIADGDGRMGRSA